MTRLTVTKIPNLNSLVIKQKEGKDFFISAEDALVIGIDSFAFLLNFLVQNEFISHKILEGILSEYNTSKGSIGNDR